MVCQKDGSWSDDLQCPTCRNCELTLMLLLLMLFHLKDAALCKEISISHEILKTSTFKCLCARF